MYNTNDFWIQCQIKTHPILEDSIIDYLVGVMGASVEQPVTPDTPDCLLNAYLKEKNPSSDIQNTLQNQIESHIKELAAIFQVAEPVISWKQIEDQDWSNNWKIHFKPFVITEGLVIVPTWEEYTANASEQILIMDPGMAFGTGHHATTSLSLDFIKKILAKENKQHILDVGTGTGVLGMGAAIFGADQVLGIDNDPEAIRVATENCTLNHLDTVMKVSNTPLQQVDEYFHTIVANIIHDVLVTMTQDFHTRLLSGGHLILSGILQGEQEKNCVRVYTNYGFILEETQHREEWVALHFKKHL